MEPYSAILNGYRVWYTDQGKQYEHTLVMEEELGRKLADGEVIHHLDLDRLNNNPSNLIVVSRAHHARIHSWLESGAPVTVVPTAGTFRAKPKPLHKCARDGCSTMTTKPTYCSGDCQRFNLRKVVDRPSKEQLTDLLKVFTKRQLGKMYEVSDRAIGKWAQQYGIE